MKKKLSAIFWAIIGGIAALSVYGNIIFFLPFLAMSIGYFCYFVYLIFQKPLDKWVDKRIKFEDSRALKRVVKDASKLLPPFDDDREFILKVIKQARKATVLSYVDDSLKKDKEFILKALKQNWSALSYASDSLRKDKEFVLKAVKVNDKALLCVHPSLRKDKEFLRETKKK
tara:strand:+ start:161 stop:676 length:516 start_codon:yes stop_codon:yes gene_type:complete